LFAAADDPPALELKAANRLVVGNGTRAITGSALADINAKVVAASGAGSMKVLCHGGLHIPQRSLIR
jgi:hypothetical protein